MIDVIDLIGAPFVWGARGPDAFDCYGLVMEVCRRAGTPIPEFADTVDWTGFNPNRVGSAAAVVASALPHWEATQTRAGSVVLFRMGKLISHVGYMLDDDFMIHAFEDSGGATIQRIDGWKHRIVGFYRYVGKR